MTSNSAFTIVVGFDGSEHSQTALNWAVDQARQRSGQLRLITVWNKAPMAWYPAVLETAAGEIAGFAPGLGHDPGDQPRTVSPSWVSGPRPPEAPTAGKLLRRRGRAAVELPGDDDVGRGMGQDGQHNDQRHGMKKLIGRNCFGARNQVPLLGRTIRTGQGAWWATWLETDPSRRPAKPPCPRDPTMSRSASLAASTSAAAAAS